MSQFAFTNVAPQVIAQLHIKQPPPPLRTSMSISPALENVVMKALEKDPGRRFGSIQAFATAMEDAISPPPRQKQPIDFGFLSNTGTTTIPDLNGQIQQQAQLPIRRRPRKTRQKVFDFAELRSSKSLLFMLGGAFIDVLCSIPLVFWFGEANLGIGCLFIVLLSRLLCATARRRKIARPFAWILVLYWTLGAIALIITTHWTFYVIVILMLALSWLFNDLWYTNSNEKSRR